MTLSYNIFNHIVIVYFAAYNNLTNLNPVYRTDHHNEYNAHSEHIYDHLTTGNSTEE